MSYGMDGWNHDNDLVRRKDVMDSLVKEYNRRFSLGERNGLKLAWIEKAVNEVDVAQQGKIQLPEEDATKGATSDLISREAAIDAIRASTSKYTGFMEMEMYTDDDAVEAIEALPPAQPEQRWIPVAERLPDMWDERYLVSLAWGGIGVMEYKSTGFHNYGSFTPVPIESILAWMPLPEPYKEDDK